MRSVPGIERMRPWKVALRDSAPASLVRHSRTLLEGSFRLAACAWLGTARARQSTAKVTRRRGIVVLKRSCALRVALSSPSGWGWTRRGGELLAAALGCAATEPLDTAAGV